MSYCIPSWSYKYLHALVENAASRLSKNLFVQKCQLATGPPPRIFILSIIKRKFANINATNNVQMFWFYYQIIKNKGAQDKAYLFRNQSFGYQVQIFVSNWLYEVNILMTLHPNNKCNSRKNIVRDTHLTIAAFLRMTALFQHASENYLTFC